MKQNRAHTMIALLAIAVWAVAGCSAPGPGQVAGSGEATVTAIPLPSRTEPVPVPSLGMPLTALPTAIGATETAVLLEAPSPKAPVTSLPSPAPTATATAAHSASVRDSTPTLEATSTPTPRPVRRTPQPTSQPELTGKLIVHTRNGGEFYTINADGTDLRRITDGEDATWSPDGRRIAFARWREPRGVWVVNADGSEEQRVFAWSDARWPSWSPDSTQILFSRQYGGRTDEVHRCFRGFCFTIPAQPHWKLGIIGLNGGAFDEPPGPDLSLAPSWAPSGKDIVYAGQNGLWVQSPDRAVSYQLTQDARDTSPAWSPDGSRVAFSRHQHDHWEIYVVDAGGHNLKRLTDTPVRFDGVVGNSVAAAWSPNGQYIAFLTDRTEKWEVWVMRADGRDQKPMLGQALSGLPLDYAFAGERALSWTY